MQRLEVSGAVRPIYGSLGVKWLIGSCNVYGDDCPLHLDCTGCSYYLVSEHVSIKAYEPCISHNVRERPSAFRETRFFNCKRINVNSMCMP